MTEKPQQRGIEKDRNRGFVTALYTLILFLNYRFDYIEGNELAFIIRTHRQILTKLPSAN